MSIPESVIKAAQTEGESRYPTRCWNYSEARARRVILALAEERN